MAKERRQPIEEFVEKIAGLMKLTGHQERAAFCQAVGIEEPMLRGCLSDNGTRGMTSSAQKELRSGLQSQIGNFLEWPEWIETEKVRIASKTRRDTAANFLNRATASIRGKPEQSSDKLAWNHDVTTKRLVDRVRELDLQLHAGATIGASTITLATDRMHFAEDDPTADVSEVTIRARRTADMRPNSKDRKLASIQLRWPYNHGIAAGASVFPLNLDLGMHRSTFGLWVQEAELRIEFNSGTSIQIGSWEDTQLFPGNLRIGGADGKQMDGHIEVHRHGDGFAPTFSITAKNGPIGGITMHELLRFEEVQPGDTVEIRLVVCIADLLGDDGEQQ